MVRSPEKGVLNFPVTEKLIGDIEVQLVSAEAFIDNYDGNAAIRELVDPEDGATQRHLSDREIVVVHLRELVETMKVLLNELREFRTTQVKRPGEKETQQRARRNFKQLQALMQTTRSWGIHEQ